jgi:hypothetical protein
MLPVKPNEAQAHGGVCRSLGCGADQILRTVVRLVRRPGGECSSGICQTIEAVKCRGSGRTAMCVTQTHWTSIAGDVAAICGVSSVRTSVRQQLIFSMCPHCPCMARQQALSSWLMTTLVTQAITGAAVVSSRRIATMPAKRRMTVSSIRPRARFFLFGSQKGV